MNRASAKAGLITAKSVRAFQRDHPVRLKTRSSLSPSASSTSPTTGSSTTSTSTFHSNSPLAAQPGVQKKPRTPLPSDTDPNHTYGKPVRPSTPVARLMIDQTEVMMAAATAAGAKAHAQGKGKKGKGHTLWRISRFVKTPHRVDDLWSSPPRTTGPDIVVPFAVPTRLATEVEVAVGIVGAK
ncbi:hypothetical protein HDU93_002009 [Gonapodya sp. JEL0774]|nr:hypothetical protein HDU93_002009 [Gonapodya sp. JEL0774]